MEPKAKIMVDKNKRDERDGDGRIGDPEPNESAKPPQIDWADPKTPVGDAPPLPRWPLIVAVAGWTAWIGFLAAMVISYTQSKI